MLTQLHLRWRSRLGDERGSCCEDGEIGVVWILEEFERGGICVIRLVGRMMEHLELLAFEDQKNVSN